MIRKPKQDELDQLLPLIMIILKDMELPFLNEVDDHTFQRMMFEAMLDDSFRYSLKNCLVCEQDGKIAGAVYGYPGKVEPKIDLPFTNLYQKYNLHTTKPFFEDSETFAGEWYLDSLVVHPEFRGRGIGSRLIHATQELAQQSGEHIIGLNCDINNSKANKLYQALGFRHHSERKLATHHYSHMQWEFHRKELKK
ncbi:Acetyltransferase (GNAT) family protein [Granulicatella balaenopterae]|uniref:Acetyltransferase (GNAT) family protein n=1 Tax=Granulicatella balaenopterae TaxID=137733 RepID=A0A1H9I3F8_9LACT|nr:GNAT family N-acetyltransferase [Granulicatella balaenopterae]SEQ69032.1 Acetyltransferase (GNAT) family protein [Granulicatella balaenopterae]